MNRIILLLLTSTAVLFASVTISPVPEPSTYLMMGAGLGAMLLLRSKFGKKK